MSLKLGAWPVAVLLATMFLSLPALAQNDLATWSPGFPADMVTSVMQPIGGFGRGGNRFYCGSVEGEACQCIIEERVKPALLAGR